MELGFRIRAWLLAAGLHAAVLWRPAAAQTHRWWRINTISGGSCGGAYYTWSLYEVQFFQDTIQYTTSAISAYGLSSGDQAGQTFDLALDGDTTTTYWSTDPAVTCTPGACYIGQDFGNAPKDINKVVLHSRTCVSTCTAVEYSDNQLSGSPSWTELWRNGYVTGGNPAVEEGKLSEQACDASTAPTNGGAGDCTYCLKHGTTCQPTCNTGYTVTGTTGCNNAVPSSATCYPSPCDVSMPTTNGYVGDCNTTIAHGTTCQPTCWPGYTGTGARSCSYGVMTEAPCFESPCTTNVDPLNGFSGDCPTILTHGTTCQPYCNTGYSVSGPGTCEYGEWTPPYCIPDSCDATSSPLNGNTGDCNATLVHGATCQIVCNTGYTAYGQTYCALGTLVQGTCEPSDCIGSAPLNGALGHCNATTFHGTTCQQECNTGYTITGVASCNYGIFVSHVCNPSVCHGGIESMPTNGGVGTCNTTMEHGSQCVPSCDTGYTISGLFLCMYGVSTVPTCNPDPCEITFSTGNGAMGGCTQFLSHGGSCNFICSNGYTLSSATTCNLGVPTLGTCEPSTCDASTPPTNGGSGNCHANLPHGTSCQPVCSIGYTVSGFTVCAYGVPTPAWCYPSPCLTTLTANMAYGDCPVVMNHSTSCQPTCATGFYVTGAYFCQYGVHTYVFCGLTFVAGNDPVTWYNGKASFFELPPGVLTPIIRNPEVAVLGSVFQGEQPSEQWFDKFVVTNSDGGKWIQVKIKRDPDLAFGYNWTEHNPGHFRTFEVKYGAADPLERAPSWDGSEGDLLENVKVAFMKITRAFKTKRPTIGRALRECMEVVGDELRFFVCSSPASEYYGHQRYLSIMYAHLDLVLVETGDASTLRGLLPEIWGLQPMSPATRAVLKEAPESTGTLELAAAEGYGGETSANDTPNASISCGQGAEGKQMWVGGGQGPEEPIVCLNGSAGEEDLLEQSVV